MKSTDEVQDGFLHYTDHRPSPVAVEGRTSSGWDRGSYYVNGFKWSSILELQAAD